MDSFELNKVFMALLGTVFIVMSLSFLSDSLFASHAPEKAGYAIEVAEASTGGDDAPTGPAYEPIEAMLASADAGAGEKVFKKCAACHTFDNGGANKVGPNLYGIVDKSIASVDGFGYSSALTEYGAGKSWTYEELNGFLFKPKKHVKGTAMGFAGLKKVKDRANLVGWLRLQSASPAPLPEATEAEPES